MDIILRRDMMSKLLVLSAGGLLFFGNCWAFVPTAHRVSVPIHMQQNGEALPSTAARQPVDEPEWAKAENDGRFRERKSLDISKTMYISTIKSPKDAYIAFAEKGAANARMSKHKIFHQAVMGGAYVGFGGLLAMTISGNIPQIAATNPAIPKMLFAALFPVNLLLCVCTGGQLFTGNTGTVAAAKYEGLVEWRELFKSYAMSLLGNIAGCFAFAWAASYIGMLEGGAGALCVNTALTKCSSTWGPTIGKAILCNWMVTLAVFLAGAANDLPGKMVGIWFPISTFVGIGLEHSVANLFIFPAALFAGAPLSIGAIVTQNMFPVIIGNLIAGGFVMAGSYGYQFGSAGRRRRLMFRMRQAKYEERKALKKEMREEVDRKRQQNHSNNILLSSIDLLQGRQRGELQETEGKGTLL